MQELIDRAQALYIKLDDQYCDDVQLDGYDHDQQLLETMAILDELMSVAEDAADNE